MKCNLVLNNKAFTLLEITFVIILISTIMFIGIPAFSNYKRSNSIKNSQKLILKVLETAKIYAISNKKNYYVIFIKEMPNISLTSQQTIKDRNLILKAVAIVRENDSKYIIVDDWIHLSKNIYFNSNTLPIDIINNVEILKNIVIDNVPYIKFDKNTGKCSNPNPVSLKISGDNYNYIYVRDYEISFKNNP